MALPEYNAREQIDITPNQGEAPQYDALAQLFGNVEKGVGRIGNDISLVENEKQQQVIEANKYLTQANVIQNVGRIYNEAQQNPNAEAALKEFNNNVQGYSQGVLQNTPKENQPYTQYLLATQTQSKLNALNSKLAEQNKAYAEEAFQNTYNTISNEASNQAATNPSAAVETTAQLKNMVQTGISVGVVGGKEAANYTQAAQKNLITNALLGQYNAKVKAGDTDGAQALMQNFMENDQYNNLFSPMEKMSVERQAESFQRINAQNAGITGQAVQSATKSAILNARTTGTDPSPDQLTIIQQGDPKNFDQVQQQLAAAKLEHGMSQQYSAGSIGDMQKGISDLSQPLSPADLKSPDASLMQSARQGAIQQLNTNIKLWKEDPAQGTSQDPNFQQQSSQLQTQIITAQPTLQNGQPNPVYQSQLLQYGKAEDNLSIQVQQAKGVAPQNISLITKGDAANLVSQIKQLPMDQQVATLTQLQQRYGANSQYVFPKLVQAGLPIASNYLVAMQNNPNSVGMVPTAIQAFSQPKGALEKALPSSVKSNQVMSSIKNNLSDYINSLQGYANISSSTIDNTYSQAHQLALQLIVNGESPNKAAQDATNSLINNHYQFQTFNGHTYRIPTGIDSSSVQQAANYLKNTVASNPQVLNDVKVPPYFYRGVAPDIRRDLYIREGIGQGYVVTNPDDSGLTFVDRYGAPVTDNSGKTYSETFQDIVNPSSDFRKNLDAINKKGQESLSIQNQLSSVLNAGGTQ